MNAFDPGPVGVDRPRDGLTLVEQFGTPLAPVRQLRHAVYVVEQGKRYESYGVHGEVTDEWDAVSMQIAAFKPKETQADSDPEWAIDQGVCVGALRATRLRDVDPSTWANHGVHLHDHSLYEGCNPTITSFLVVNRSWRLRSEPLLALLQSAYRYGCDVRCLANLVHTDCRLAPLYAKLGFRRIGGEFLWSRSGRTHVLMTLLLADAGYLERIGSIFAKDSLARFTHDDRHRTRRLTADLWPSGQADCENHP